MEFEDRRKAHQKTVKWDGLASYILNGNTEYELLVDKLNQFNDETKMLKMFKSQVLMTFHKFQNSFIMMIRNKIVNKQLQNYHTSLIIQPMRIESINKISCMRQSNLFPKKMDLSFKIEKYKERIMQNSTLLRTLNNESGFQLTGISNPTFSFNQSRNSAQKLPMNDQKQNQLNITQQTQLLSQREMNIDTKKIFQNYKRNNLQFQKSLQDTYNNGFNLRGSITERAQSINQQQPQTPTFNKGLDTNILKRLYNYDRSPIQAKQKMLKQIQQKIKLVQPKKEIIETKESSDFSINQSDQDQQNNQ
ncbi:UNKNOWN [Stylonychia lemnae]|uniref:Uncharacterized protein n=1 Tax=Stylonychia lemnae TaxID=5949 RepID=A0A077ZXT6_STYLE|nr:UNKNOWN [Stylonychia lemnae]|eukprot:CDW74397.1 UNKNOWN [Stylonychia lemnae]